MHIAHLLPVLSLVASPVYAYGVAGHEIVADIAQMHLFPSTMTALSLILPKYAKGHLGPVAAWADKIKYANRWSSALHYVNGVGDHPGNRCVFGEQGWEGKPGINVLGGIRNTTDWLMEGKPGAEEALKFLVHFMGDLHMPLHLTGRAKGGNDIRVRWNRRLSKFHAVWDGLLVAKEIRDTPPQYDYPLPIERVESALRGAVYDPYTRRIVFEGLLDEWVDEIDSWTSCNASQTPISDSQVYFGLTLPRTDDGVACPFYWAKPMHALNCDIVWPKELDDDYSPPIELDTPAYSGRIANERILQKLFAMGGIRLAAILNSLFGDPEEMNGKVFTLI